MNVLPNVTLQLWGSLLQRRGYEVTDGEVILSPSKAKAAAETRKDGLPTRHPAISPLKQPEPEHEGKSIISQFRRANSFAPAVSSKEASSSRHLPFRRTTTTSAVFAGNSEAGPSRLPHQNAHPVAASSTSGPASFPQIFAGKTIRALGEAKGPNVRQAVEQHGGRMSADPDEDVDYIVVRLVRLVSSEYFSCRPMTHFP